MRYSRCAKGKDSRLHSFLRCVMAAREEAVNLDDDDDEEEEEEEEDKRSLLVALL